MPDRKFEPPLTDYRDGEKLLISPKAGCVIMILCLFVIPVLVLSWYPIKWRMLLSRLDDENETVVLDALKDMRQYPAKDMLPVFFRLWAATPSRNIAGEIESDLMRAIPFSHGGLGTEYFLPMIAEPERDDFAKRLSRAFETGNDDQRRRALYVLYILRGSYIEDMLLEALKDESMPVRHVARLCLTEIGDYELLESVLESLREEGADVINYSRVAVLGSGFDMMLPLLVTRLGAKAAVDREKAIELLKILTRETLGYRADDPPDARAEAAAKWREYIEERRKKDEEASPP